MDWVKMRSDIYRDPRVCEMAEQLTANHSCDRNVMRNATVGALVTFWGVTRHRGHRYNDDLQLPKMKLSVVDSIVELPGFGAAMVAVGWIVERDECLILPRFFEGLNVDPTEKTRVQNAERQRRYRERNRNVTGDVTVTQQSNIEKRRVEKRTKKRETPSLFSGSEPSDPNPDEWVIPPNLDSPEVRELLQFFEAMRQRIKKPIKCRRDSSRILPSFRDRDHLLYALNYCIANDYQGLKPEYSPTQTNGRPVQPPPPMKSPSRANRVGAIA